MNKTKITDKQQKRKIVWLNPPLSLNVKTNVGKLFLRILRKTFRKLIPCQRSLTETQLKLATVVLET